VLIVIARDEYTVLEDLYEIYRGRREANGAILHPHRWLAFKLDLRWAIYNRVSRLDGTSTRPSSPDSPLLQIGDRQVFEISDVRHALRKYPRSGRGSIYLASPEIAALYRDQRLDMTWAESFIADSLAEQDPSLRLEVATPVGYVDCLSDTRLIEIKRLNRWKEGLGQLCAYGVYLPGRLRVLHLFDQNDAPRGLTRAREVCEKYSVTVEYSRCDLPKWPASLFAPSGGNR
jgi:hypothetical protein